MKPFICIPLFLFISLLGFSQKHSIGLNVNPSASALFKKDINPNAVYTIIPSNPSIEINYIFQRTEKTALMIGGGLGFQSIYSHFIDEWYPEARYLDIHTFINIPVEYRYMPKKWFYLGAGLNNKIEINSRTSASYGYTLEDYKNRPYILEATGSTGVQLDFWKLTYRFGLYTEVPLIHREYVNLGLETGLYYSF